MLLPYLFLIVFAGGPLASDSYAASYMHGPPRDPPPTHTCNCNCNFPKPMSYADPYGNQQAVVCVPVPITVQGMYPQNFDRPGYMPAGSPPSNVRPPDGFRYPPGTLQYPDEVAAMQQPLPGYMHPGVPSDLRRPGYMASPEGPSYPPGYGSVPGIITPAQDQPLPGVPFDLRRPGYMASPEGPSYPPGYGSATGEHRPAEGQQSPPGVSSKPAPPTGLYSEGYGTGVPGSEAGIPTMVRPKQDVTTVSSVLFSRD